MFPDPSSGSALVSELMVPVVEAAPCGVEAAGWFSSKMVWANKLGDGSLQLLGVLKKLVGGSLKGLIDKHNFSGGYQYHSQLASSFFLSLKIHAGCLR